MNFLINSIDMIGPLASDVTAYFAVSLLLGHFLYHLYNRIVAGLLDLKKRFENSNNDI